MHRLRTLLSLLLNDERSAMPRRMAILASLVILATMVAGVILMSFGEQTYRDLDRRVLIALQHEPVGGLAI